MILTASLRKAENGGRTSGRITEIPEEKTYILTG
jgi:hypothetical protein